MVLKKYQNPSGGLNEAGRKHFERKDGGNLKELLKQLRKNNELSCNWTFNISRGIQI